MLSVSINTFIKDYSKAISEGYAAVFAGAGLSQSSGYLNWKELISPLAQRVGLDIQKEHDLISIAQYFFNEEGNRNNINQLILNSFNMATSENANLDMLTRLPISTYWTTNYDELIEDGLRKNFRKPDIKVTQKNLATNLHDRDAVVYKMHGDVRNPDDAILIKDDYETYAQKHPLFTTALQGDLISKTFLFIGFSFEDPNLDYILSRIRVLLGEDVRNHYCFLEEIKNNGDEVEYAYNKTKQELRIKDLKRYGIQTVLLDDYSQITVILENIEKNYKLNNIFVSGSISKYDNVWTKEKVNYFTYNLSKALVSCDFKIISGVGSKIGDNIINGALDEIINNKYRHIDEHLCLRPFPQFASNVNDDLTKLWNNYRVNMITESGIVIFIFGNKNIDGKCVDADGVIKEFGIAKIYNKYIIPVGSTGYASEYIYSQVKKNIKSSYPYLEPYIEKLGIEQDSDNLISLLIDIVTELRKNIILI